jgi:hypothetical protein
MSLTSEPNKYMFHILFIYACMHVYILIFEIRKFDELRLYNKPEIFRFLSSEVLERIGHLWRTEDFLTRKFHIEILSGKRPIRRPRQR